QSGSAGPRRAVQGRPRPGRDRPGSLPAPRPTSYPRRVMYVLDTDTLSLLMRGHERLLKRTGQVEEEIVISVISRIEILEGRFASVLKAEDGEKLFLAQQRFDQTEAYLGGVRVVSVEATASAKFDKLRANKKLKKIGRADL